MVFHYNYVITIMQDGYPCTFKIFWLYSSHALNSIKNLKEETLWSRFQVDSFHEFIMTKFTNKAARQVSLSKGQSISRIVQAMSFREGGRSQGSKLLNI